MAVRVARYDARCMLRRMVIWVAPWDGRKGDAYSSAVVDPLQALLEDQRRENRDPKRVATMAFRRQLSSGPYRWEEVIDRLSNSGKKLYRRDTGVV